MEIARLDDVAQMHAQIVVFFQQHQCEADIFLPWAAQQMRGKIYASCTVLDAHSNEEGTFLTIRGEREDVDALCLQFGLNQEEPDAEQ